MGAPPDKGDARAREVRSAPEATLGLRVLLVDDEADIRELVTLVLVEIAGFDVTSAESGPEAVAVGGRARPQVVLLDASMPGWDGPRTMGELRRHPWGAEVPVIFMTANADDADVVRYRELGALGVIAKPFDPETLAERVLAMLG